LRRRRQGSFLRERTACCNRQDRSEYCCQTHFSYSTEFWRRVQVLDDRFSTTEGSSREGSPPELPERNAEQGFGGEPDSANCMFQVLEHGAPHFRYPTDVR
jgi:hypothetical protein